MHAVKRNGHWLVAGVGLLCLGLSAGLSLQHVLTPLNAQDAAKAPADVAEMKELSTTFRSVSRQVMPGVVAIETVGRRGAGGEGNMDDLFGENSPFPEFFRNNPELKEYFKRNPPQRQRGMGSGFVIDPSGVILTNNHVVNGAEEVRVRMYDGTEYLATDVKTDPRADLAVLRIKPDKPLTALRLGDSDTAEIGDWVLAVGSPFGLDMTVTAGIISAKGRGMHIAEREDFLQTDAAINPGNSGGPLINLNGEVVGINTAIASRSGGADGVGFAVPVNMAKWVFQQLLERGAVTRAYLGIAMQDLTSEFAKPLNLPVNGGVLVTEVKPNSPAAAAGIETGDVILKAFDKELHSPRGLQSVVEQMKIGSKYDIVLLRDGKQMTVSVEAQEMPRDYVLRQSSRPLRPAEKDEEPAKRSEVNSLGVEVSEITPKLAERLSFKTEGVVITRVDSDTPAEKIGLEPGMAIEKVNGKKVTSPAEFDEAVKAAADKTLTLSVRTEAGTRMIEVETME